MAEAAGVRARVAAAWLAGGRGLHLLSMALLLPALWLLCAMPVGGVAQSLSALAIAAAIAETYFALRVAFDCRIFAGWAMQWEGDATHDPAATLAEFDACLVAMGLRRNGGGRGPCLDERIAGALRLLRKQAACSVVQLLFLSAAAWWCRVGA